MVYTIHAISYLGAVGVLLNTKLTDQELNFQLDDADVNILITNDGGNRNLRMTESYKFQQLEKMEEGSFCLSTISTSMIHSRLCILLERQGFQKVSYILMETIGGVRFLRR